MKRVGILNVTGYAGVELARLLCRHPEVKLASVTGRSAAGQSLGQVFPHLASVDLTITEELDEVDFVFSALDHKVSAERVLPFVHAGLPVVDLSADFRLRSADDYQQWYKVEHPEPKRLSEAVYGLTELHREELPSAKLVANPGCYPPGPSWPWPPPSRPGLSKGTSSWTASPASPAPDGA